MTRRITIEHNGTTYYGQVATIKSTRLGIEDHGIVTAYLMCEWPGGGIGVGGYGLDTPVKVDGKFSHREGTGYGLDHIMRLAQTVGSDTWEGAAGKQVIILFDSPHPLGSTAAGIANTVDEKNVLILKEHAANWLEAHPQDADR